MIKFQLSQGLPLVTLTVPILTPVACALHVSLTLVPYTVPLH